MDATVVAIIKKSALHVVTTPPRISRINRSGLGGGILTAPFVGGNHGRTAGDNECFIESVILTQLIMKCVCRRITGASVIVKTMRRHPRAVYVVVFACSVYIYGQRIYGYVYM